MDAWKKLPTWARVAGVVGAGYAAREVFERFNEKSVEGQVVLVTGGASGIGRLMALKFAALRAKVAIWDMNLVAANTVGACCVARVLAARTPLGPSGIYVAKVTCVLLSGAGCVAWLPLFGVDRRRLPLCPLLHRLFIWTRRVASPPVVGHACASRVARPWIWCSA
jgi:hypothetical protein